MRTGSKGYLPKTGQSDGCVVRGSIQHILKVTWNGVVIHASSKVGQVGEGEVIATHAVHGLRGRGIEMVTVCPRMVPLCKDRHLWLKVIERFWWEIKPKFS